MVKSADTVLKEFNTKYNEGDEELAYIFLMKYFSILNFIKSAPDYANEKKYIMAMLGPNTQCNERMNLLEKITNSLIER